MAEQTRLGRPMHPHVFVEDGWANITMRVHLAERKGWAGARAAYINYAKGKRGWVVQFEEEWGDCTYSCHFLLQELRSAHFWAKRIPSPLEEFAQSLGVRADALLTEALVHAVRLG